MLHSTSDDRLLAHAQEARRKAAHCDLGFVEPGQMGGTECMSECVAQEQRRRTGRLFSTRWTLRWVGGPQSAGEIGRRYRSVGSRCLCRERRRGRAFRGGCGARPPRERTRGGGACAADCLASSSGRTGRAVERDRLRGSTRTDCIFDPTNAHDEIHACARAKQQDQGATSARTRAGIQRPTLLACSSRLDRSCLGLCSVFEFLVCYRTLISITIESCLTMRL